MLLHNTEVQTWKTDMSLKELVTRAIFLSQVEGARRVQTVVTYSVTLHRHTITFAGPGTGPRLDQVGVKSACPIDFATP